MNMVHYCKTACSQSQKKTIPLSFLQILIMHALTKEIFTSSLHGILKPIIMQKKILKIKLRDAMRMVLFAVRKIHITRSP